MADVVIKYRNTSIGTLSDSGTKTLETAGKYCDSDIEVQYTNPGGGGSGTIYQDAEGYLVVSDEGGGTDYDGPYTFTPSESTQTIQIGGKLAASDITINAVSSTYVGTGVPTRGASNLSASGSVVTVPSGYYSSQVTKAVSGGSVSTPATTITVSPTISINSSTGVITAAASSTKSVTPSVTAGYIASGNAGTITVTGSSTTGLSVQTATTITPSTSSQTAVAAGKYTTGAVTVAAMPAGTAGTPVATKGTVSNHSISITPSVTNTTGYIVGSTKTGTAATVSASELVSGSTTITANGTGINVTNYATVDVNVSGSSITVESLNVTSNGTYTAPSGKAYSPVTVNVSGGAAAESDAVRFIDYDGTIVYTYSASDFLALSAMPSNPSHSRLTAQGWNWDLDEAKDYVQDWGYLDIGQQYITSSGDTEIDIEFPAGFARLSPYLQLAINGSVTINWGDNSSTDTVTGTSLTTRISTQHTYSNTGNYTISIHLNNGSFCFYNTSTYTLFHANNSSLNYNKVYSNCIKAVRIGTNNINNTISNYAFYCCTGLEYITIPKKLDSVSAFAYSTSSSFASCYRLRAITIPRGCTNPGSMGSSYSLKYILLPNTITTLASNGLSSVYALSSFIAPSSITSYPTSLFGSSSSKVINPQRIIIPYQNRKVIIPAYNPGNILANKTAIAYAQFDSITNLFTFDIPNTITSIQSNAFEYSEKMQTITIPSSVSTIAQYAFSYCYSLESIDLSHLSYFSNRMLYYCYALQNVILPSTISNSNYLNIPDYFFYYCYSLRNVTLPTNITSIGGSAFSGCSALASIVIPNTVTSIGTSAFSGCIVLSSITIPAAVTTIGIQAFSGCYGMKEYHFKSTTPPTITNTNVFQNIPSDCIIYVPSASLNTYKTADYWSTYASYMVGE